MTNDWTRYFDFKESSERTILSATLALTKNDVIDGLRVDYIFINGKFYRTPKSDLLDLLRDDVLSDKAICVELELEETDL